MATINPDARQAAVGSAFIVLGALGFSAKSILIKIAYGDSAQIDAITLMTLRMLMALPFFVAVALWSREPGETKRRRADWMALAVLGLMGYYVASFLDFKGLEYISAGMERLILFLYPTLVALLTALVYRRRISTPKRWALALGYAGILLVYGSDTHARSPEIALGAMLVLGSALTFALYLTGSGHLIPRFGSKRFTAYSMSIACIATILHFLVSKPLDSLAVSGKVMGLALTLALVSTVAPAFLMNAGIRRIGADRAAIVGTLGPVSTLAMAYAFLGETLAPLQMVGAALVLGGVVLVGLFRDP